MYKNFRQINLIVIIITFVVITLGQKGWGKGVEAIHSEGKTYEASSSLEVHGKIHSAPYDLDLIKHQWMKDKMGKADQAENKVGAKDKEGQGGPFVKLGIAGISVSAPAPSFRSRGSAQSIGYGIGYRIRVHPLISLSFLIERADFELSQSNSISGNMIVFTPSILLCQSLQSGDTYIEPFFGIGLSYVNSRLNIEGQNEDHADIGLMIPIGISFAKVMNGILSIESNLGLAAGPTFMQFTGISYRWTI